MNALRLLACAAATLVVGVTTVDCSLTTSDEPTGDPGVRQAEALFSVPTDPAADTANLYGVWQTAETRTEGVDVTSRFELRADAIVVATQCFDANAPREPRYSVVVSVRSQAVITPSSIDIAESDEEAFHIREGKLCGVRIVATRPVDGGAAPPAPLGACTKGAPSCFTFEGGRLTIVLAGTRYEMTKIAD